MYVGRKHIVYSGLVCMVCMATNVLIIVEDALSADRLDMRGDIGLTPFFRSLASDSAFFTRAFSTTNATDPAITSIQTGRIPLSHGIVNHGKQIRDKEKQIIQDIQTLPEVFSDAGYRTAKFGRPLGRWHRSGFDIYPHSGESKSSFDGEPNLETRVSQALESIDPRIQNTASAIYRTTVERVKQAFF